MNRYKVNCFCFVFWMVFAISTSNAESLFEDGSRFSVPVTDSVTLIQDVDSDSVNLEANEDPDSVDSSNDSSEGVSDLVLFFGRFHPIFVHLPIGFLLFAFLLEFASSIERYKQLEHAVPFALLMGGISGIMAGATGYMLSLGGGYGEDLLSSHKWFGTSVIILSFVAFIIKVKSVDNPALKKPFRFLLVLLIGVVMTTGHYGGSLTHGSDFLFRYMPDSLRTMMGLELEEEEQIELIEDLDTARVYDDIIYPILRTRCESCHNPDRMEGELLLTSFDNLMVGGESGPVIVRNHAEESELYKRLLLPARDDDRMPPRGRRQLTTDQIHLLEWWINHGVPYSEMISELEISEDIMGILEKLTVSGQSFFARTSVPPADQEIIEELREEGFRINPVAEGIHFLQVTVSKSKTTLSAEDLELLRPLAEQITWIDFRDLPLTDNDLEILSDFRNLTRLNISNTDITDRTLEIISSLENLEYLNVYSTEVSDEGLKHIEGFTNLDSFYVWRTNVSREAVLEMQEKWPDTYINSGYDFDNEPVETDENEETADVSLE